MPLSSLTMPFRLGTFSVGNSPPFAGLVLKDRALALTAATAFLERVGLELAATESILAVLEQWPRNVPVLHRIAAALATGSERDLEEAAVPRDSLRFHPPVNLPRQIFCAGANYRKHVVELIVANTPPETEGMSPEERRKFAEMKVDKRAAQGTPFFFCKAQSTVIGPFDPIVLPTGATQPDWELELGVVIGRTAHRVQRADALDYVAGYMVVNDITARDRQKRKDAAELGLDWVASKCSPTFLPTGPYLVPASFVGDPQNLQLTLRLNGQTMQNESTSDMIFDVARLIEALSTYCLLQPGDLICTGSPAGNGVHYGRFLRPGDVLEGSIAGLGTQSNRCIAE